MEKVKRKRFGRRILSVVLAVALMVGLMPEIPGTVLTAHAAEAGAFTVDGGVEGTDYTYADGVLTIKTATPMTIKNSNPEIATTDRIVVAEDVSANITLAGVNIDVSGKYNAAAFEIKNDSTGDVTITLADDSTNILMSGENCAGLQKNGTKGKLIICGGAKGNGSLEATGGSYGAGIGGGGDYGAGTGITISGGNVTATGGSYGAGIGGGCQGAGTGITISGGTVTAQGGEDGAGIGGGFSKAGTGITISGGTVTAQGGSSGAGIGGGNWGDGTKITISGGSVKAIAGIYSQNAIGGGDGFDAAIPTLEDGTPVYLLTVQNENSENIKINEKDYPKAHGEDKAIYVYLPAIVDGNTLISVQVGDVVTKYCCDNIENKKWLKAIDAPKEDESVYVYDGNPKNYQIAASADYTISGNTQTNAGTYTVTVTRNDAENTMWSDGTTGDKEFTFVIQEADSVLAEAPTAKSGLVYDGLPHVLIEGGSATNGTLQYSLSEDGTYSETLPVGTNAGDYTVYYKVVGATNYSDTAVQSITASIAQAAPKLGKVTGNDLVLTGEPTGVSDLVQSIQRTNDTIAGTFEITDAEVVYGTHTYNWKFTPTDGNYKAVTGTVTIKVTKEPGTDDNVYQISSAGELLWLAEQVNTRTITGFKAILTKDIVIPDNKWVPMDVDASSVLDGDGHSITINSNNYTSKFGLFNRCNNSEVKNLILKGNITVNSAAEVGVLCGSAYKSTFTNVTSYVNITNSGAGPVGGLAGKFGGQAGSEINNCAVYADISGTTAGGLVGLGWDNTQYYNIKNSVYVGDVTGTTAGAIVGEHKTTWTNSVFDNVFWYEKDGLSFYGATASVNNLSTVSAKTTEQFASGEVAYLLNNGKTDGTQSWYQTLSGNEPDAYPLLDSTHSTVYSVLSCDGTTPVYRNVNENLSHIDENSDEYCDKCEKIINDIGVNLAGHSVSLGDQIGMNFYMDLTDSVLGDDTAYMLFTLADGSTRKVFVKDVKNSSVDINEKSYFVFTCKVAAKEMADTITAKIVCENGTKEGDTYSCSVKQYAEALLGGNTATDAQKKLAKAMLNYGAYAQLYFGYNTNNLANAGNADNELAVMKSELQSFKPVVDGENETFTYAGSTLLLEADVKVRHYFKLKEGQEYTGSDLTLYAAQPGDNLTGTYYYWESAGIPAASLGTMTVYTDVNGISINYCPLSYVTTAVVNTDTTLTEDTNLQNLLKALYLYYQATK